MKLRAFSIILILAVIGSMFALPMTAKAVAYGATFTTSITYMNIGTSAANVTMLFYPAQNATPVTWNEPALPVNAAASLYAGTVFASSFSGSAVVSSDSPLAVTGVQTSTTVKNRMLSNGFSSGAAVFTIPTVLKGTFTTNSIFSVQNADSEANNVTVTFNPVSGSPFSDTITGLPAGAAKIYDMGSVVVSGLGATFNGSVKITAKKTASPAVDGSVVASSQELSTINDNSYAFEGATNGGSTVYMPSAFCGWGVGLVQSAFAVMNMGANPVDLTVTYRVAGSATTYTDTVTGLAAGLKASLAACTVAPAGFIGSATITATGTSPSIVAIGKIYNGGLSTAYSGFAAGSQIVALPYVRFTNSFWTAGTKQRVFIAIQNVGAGALAVGAVSAKFYDADGNLVGTLTNTTAIAVGDKWSVAANQLPGGVGNEFGYWATKTGGGAIISGPAGAQLAVIGRAQTYLSPTTSTGEDYNAIPVQ
jgi:hypothetical protein